MSSEVTSVRWILCSAGPRRLLGDASLAYLAVNCTNQTHTHTHEVTHLVQREEGFTLQGLQVDVEQTVQVLFEEQKGKRLFP